MGHGETDFEREDEYEVWCRITASLLSSVASGDAAKTNYASQFHPASRLTRAIEGALRAFADAEKFTWPEEAMTLLDLHDHRPAWRHGGPRLERLRVQLRQFRPKTLFRFVIITSGAIYWLKLTIGAISSVCLHTNRTIQCIDYVGKILHH